MVSKKPIPSPNGGGQKLESDAALISLVSKGDREASATLVRSLYNRIHGMARYMSPYPDEVEDLVQDVFVGIFSAAKKYQASGCLEAWSDVIAARIILRKLSGLHRIRRLFIHGDTEDLPPVNTIGNTETGFIDQLQAKRTVALLYKLSPAERMAITLKLVLHHTVPETAVIMDRNIDSVRYLLRRGRINLRTIASEVEGLNRGKTR